MFAGSLASSTTKVNDLDHIRLASRWGIPNNIRMKALIKPIKLLALDVDGVLTDCRVFLDESGEWRRFFSIRDGYGLKRLMDFGYQTALITASKAKDISERARALGVNYLFDGNLDKVPAFEELMKKTGFSEKEIAYMGDDLFDIPLLKRVGFAATVPDAMEDVKESVHYVAKRPGGNGAVREICDLIVKDGAYSD
jgi:3-deoxy-D-manno-octulosonate 8-phosphate phosphatase (KDO 8-P phosphatase)